MKHKTILELDIFGRRNVCSLKPKGKIKILMVSTKKDTDKESTMCDSLRVTVLIEAATREENKKRREEKRSTTA